MFCYWQVENSAMLESGQTLVIVHVTEPTPATMSTRVTLLMGPLNEDRDGWGKRLMSTKLVILSLNYKNLPLFRSSFGEHSLWIKISS